MEVTAFEEFSTDGKLVDGSNKILSNIVPPADEVDVYLEVVMPVHTLKDEQIMPVIVVATQAGGG